MPDLHRTRRTGLLRGDAGRRVAGFARVPRPALAAAVLVLLITGAVVRGVGLPGTPSGLARPADVARETGPVAPPAEPGRAASPTPPPVSAVAVPTPSGRPGADRPGDGSGEGTRAAGQGTGGARLPAALLGARALPARGSLADVRQDQGVSVPLPDGRSLWIFADTIQQGRDPQFFVTSSAAVSQRGSVRLTYLTDDGAEPLEFLRRSAAERATQVAGVSYTAVWPTGATMLPDDRIVISYATYDVTVSPASYTFRSAGLYSYRYRGIGSVDDGTHATRLADGLWGVADGPVGSPVYADGYVHLTRCVDLRCYALRTTPAGLTDRSSYRWWTGSGWSADAGQRRAMSYGSGTPGTNPSVTRLPGTDLFVTASTPAGSLSGTGQLWVAAQPWGPWSNPRAFGLPGCGTAGCYHLNVHPAESGPGRVRIGYATAAGPHVHVTDVPIRLAGSPTRPTVS